MNSIMAPAMIPVASPDLAKSQSHTISILLIYLICTSNVKICSITAHKYMAWLVLLVITSPIIIALYRVI